MRNIVTWVLTAVLVLAFLGAGSAKLTSQAMMIGEFHTFDLPIWFMYVTGLLEVGGAILVLVPRVAGIGAALFVCIMAGALVAHLTHGQAAMIGAPIVLLLLAVAVGSLRGWSGLTGRTLATAQP
jgi:uncharacterized membrane protein YphA (DoxX/SURF4 family)